jgi:hypothetical protein
MASSYSTRIRLEKQADGENPNTWGLRLNENVIDMVDEAVAGYENINVAAATTITLTTNNGTTDQSRNLGLKLQGNLTENKYVILPAKEKIYFINNDTTGSHSIYLRQEGLGDETLVSVAPQGTSMMVAVDPTDGVVDSLVAPTSVINASNAVLFNSTSTTQYVRTDQQSRVSVGGISFDDSVSVEFGDSDDVQLYFNGTDMYMDITSPSDFYIREGTTTRFTYDLGDGSFTATGNITAFSDERLKSNIKTLDGSKVFDMRGVSYTKEGKENSGVIAQELEKVAPELVFDSGEYKSVAYGNIVGYLIEAIKLLKEEIDELKSK